MMLAALICVFGIFCIPYTSFASQNTALLVTGLSNTKAGQNGINWMEKVIKSNEEWKNCKVKYLAYNGERKKGMTATEFSQTITRSFSNCEGKTAIFYFVGHGTDFNGYGDGLKVHEGVKYSYKDLAENLARVKCKKMIIILDCCRAGGFIKRFEGLKNKAAKKRTIIITSSSNTQEVLFQNDHYFCFSKALYQGLSLDSSMKIKADINQDGTVLASEFVNYINNKMATQKWAGLKNKKANQTAQSHIGKGNPVLFSYSLKTGFSSRSIYEEKSFSFSTKLFGSVVSSGKLDWDLSTKGIVSVKRKGNKLCVTGKKPGKTTITVKYGNLQSTIDITVKGTSITLNKTSISLTVGDSKLLISVVIGPSSKVEWTSSDLTVATVSGGKVTGKAAGKATITATSNGKKATCKVTVVGSVATVSAGDYHDAILKKDGTLWMYGVNTSGQLGDGTTQTSNEPKKVMSDVIQVSAGSTHTAIIKADGSLWTCGSNFCGELCDGTTQERHVPLSIMSEVKDVCAGFRNTAILKTDGTLWMCGMNNFGQLGDIPCNHIDTPFLVMSNVAQIFTSGYHTAILKEDGTLWMWGHNAYGQLGDGTNQHRYEPVQVMNNVAQVSLGIFHTMILRTDGSVWMCGWNEYGQLGDGTTEKHNIPVKVMDGATQVSAGSCSSAVLKSDGSLWMFGENDNGQLGDDTTQNRNIPVKIMSGVAQVSVGNDHTAAVMKNGTLWIWGCGSPVASKKPVQVM